MILGNRIAPSSGIWFCSKKVIAFLLFVLVSSAPCLAQKTPASPHARLSAVDHYKPQGFVNDFAGVLDSETKSQLTLICQNLDHTKDVQLAIVTLDTIDGASIKDFATQLFNDWGLGHKDTNRGLLVLLAIKDHHYRISTGFGLESVITNDKAAILGREMVPMLHKGEYGHALVHLAERIQTEIPEKDKTK